MGPPGTGKTTFGFDLMEFVVRRHQEYLIDGSKSINLVVLLTAWTKVAVSVLLNTSLAHEYPNVETFNLGKDDKQ
eukprot:2578733-Karenia_brevis.AAC.1